MAYMHKKTFEIYFEVYDVITPDDYFFVDDLIALPIQTLNRKGYTTTFCCSGHPFNQQFQDEIVPYSDPVEYKREYYTGMGSQSYISFSEGVTSLPELPDGFYKDTGAGYTLTIRKNYDYDGIDVYGFMPVIVETMKKLYEWTLSLPEYSSINKNNDLPVYEKPETDEVMRIAEERIKVHGLDIKLTNAEYVTVDDTVKLVFYFTADRRIDLITLIMDLIGIFNMRIELRQV